MEHPEVRWSTVSSCLLHYRHLLSISSFKILFLKQFVLVTWSWAATIVLSVSPMMSPEFSHQYPRSISTSFSSKLRNNCPCILFPRRLSFLFCAILSFICLAPLCTSVLSRLSVCNNAHLTRCSCILSVSVSGSSLLSNSSTRFVISTAWAASNCIKPLPPCFLRTYKRSTSACGWCCQWMVSRFLVFLSNFCSSYWCLLTIPKLYLSTGTANDPVAWILFFGLNSVTRINFNLLKYFFFKFSFPFLCCMSWLSFMSHFIYTALESSPLMSFSNMLPTYLLLWTLPYFKHILYTFLIQNSCCLY